MKITELSIKRPSLVIVFFIAFLILGPICYMNLSYEMIPKISAPVVSIVTIYPGASPDEVETSLTKKIEDAVSGIDKVKSITANSSEGVSAVIIEFLHDANMDFALQDVQRKVNEIIVDLPDDVKMPTVSKIALDEQPILRVAISSTMPSKEFYTLLTDQIKPKLAKIEGVAQIDFIGGDEREIRVNIDRQKLESYGLSAAQVAGVLKVSNLEFPTGTLKDSDDEYIVRISGKISKLDVLRNLIVGKSGNNGDIRLGDIAEIQDGQVEIAKIARLNGMTAVGMFVKKQSDANAVEVSDVVKKTLTSLESEYSDISLKFHIAEDPSRFTIASANAVKEDLFIAIILVALVMLLFLHSIRNSLVVMITIPTALIPSFIVLYMLDYSLNVITLLAMSTVIGVLVDDAIIVIENVFQHLERGESRWDASLTAIKEIGLAATAIALVISVVMVPLLVIQGITGNIFKQMAVVVIVTTMFSLLVSLTLTPMLTSRFAKLEQLKSGNRIGRFLIWFEKKYLALDKYYENALSWSIKRPRLIITAMFIALIGSVALIPFRFIGTELAAPTDEDKVTMTLETAPGTKLQEMNENCMKIEKKLAEIPEVKMVFATVGISSNLLLSESSSDIASLSISLVDKKDRKRSQADIEQLAREIASEIPGVRAVIEKETLGLSGRAPIQIQVRGTDRDSVMLASTIVADVVRKVPGTADVKLSSEEGKPEMKVNIDRDKLASLGLSLAEVGSVLRIALTGNDDTKFHDGFNQYGIRVLFDEFDRQKTRDLGSISFKNNRGQQIQLKQFADIYRSTGPSKLERSDRNACVTVNSQTVGRGSGTIVDDIDNLLENTKLPAGVSYRQKGHKDVQDEAFGDLAFSFVMAILFIYMILVALYDSFVYPFVVLFSIPGALIGALLMLALTMSTLNLFSLLGMVMMVGLVAKNAILLVDRANQLRIENKIDAIESMKQAAASRFRPIVMTTIAMVFGMLPIALAANPGSELKNGMGWAIIGGLSSSLVITLVVVPVVYVLVEKIRVRLAGAIKTNRFFVKEEIEQVEVNQ